MLNRLSRSIKAAVVATWVAVGTPTVAHADTTPALYAEPAPAGDSGTFVERARSRGHLLVSARIMADYARAPLTLVNYAAQEDPVVTDQLFVHALASLALWHRLVIHVDAPFAALQAGSSETVPGVNVPRVDPNAAFGDLRLGARARFLGSTDEDPIRANVAASANVWFPTSPSGYSGNESARGMVGLVADGNVRNFFWSVNLGALIRPLSELSGALPYRSGSGVHIGAAVGFAVDSARTVALGTEAVADLTLDGARLFDPRATVAHLLLTGHYRIAGGPFEVGAAFGPSVGQGPGAADYRITTFFGYAPTTEAPPPDTDADTVPDKVDACLNLPGVPSPDPLLHGCPEAPRDRDGDAIPDQYDACPKVPGEATAERKTHGCPRDTDKDGVIDDEDDCPRVAGLKPPEGSGCPKVEPPKPPTTAELVADVIVLSQMVQFETGTATLRSESDAILGEVARILKEHPELLLVEVQGHTDERGAPDLNRKLGEDRAASVVAWLVVHGIAGDRLVAKGYGSDKPIADNTTDEGRAKNRRVELRVLRTQEGTQPTPNNAPNTGAPPTPAPSTPGGSANTAPTAPTAPPNTAAPNKDGPK
ncbi:MAG: OmpA family protein [Polyangiaceae bacterium]|nr:OmpA family protein [Polyangiaceae bacterium]